MPTFAALRQRGPILPAKLPLIGETWITTTFEATNRVLRDNKAFVNDPRNAGGRSTAGVKWWMPRWIRTMTQNMLGKDEPDHRRLRALVDDAFARQSIETMRPRLAELADEHLDNLERAARDGGTVDFIAAFSRPLPVAVICELLGLPKEDHEKFIKWASFGTNTSVLGMLKAFGGLRKILKYLRLSVALGGRHS